MHRLLTLIGAVVIICLLAVPALAANPDGSWDGTSATATVDISLTILPYAKVEFDQETLAIDLEEGNTSGTFYTGGTVTCNCDVALTASVKKPGVATGTWTAEAQLNWANPSLFYSATLLKFSISEETAGYNTALALLDGTLVTELPTLDAGQATITVMQIP